LRKELDTLGNPVTAPKSAIDKDIRNFSKILNKFLTVGIWISGVQQVPEVGQKLDPSRRKLLVETDFQRILKVGVGDFRGKNGISIPV